MKKNHVAILIGLAMLGLAGFAPAAHAAATTDSANGMGHMKMPMTEEAANLEPTRQAFTADHRFLVELLSLPTPIPLAQYFQLRFAVYDGHDPARRITDATLKIVAGMRHGQKHGFAHGMQSSPRVEVSDGVFTVSGMYFHMRGPWALEITVQQGDKRGTAAFDLPCCGQ